MTLSGAVSDIAISRIVEQGAIFLAALVLAAGTTPEDFAIAAILFTVVSAAAALADVGVGLQLLRSPTPGIAPPMLVAVTASAGIAIVAAAVGLVAGGSIGLLLCFGGAIWALSALVQLGRSVALRDRDEHLVLRSSAAGALVLLAAVSLLPVSNVGIAAGVAIVAKLGTEALALGRLPAVGEAGSRQSWLVFGNQALNYIGANLDFLLVGVILGPAAFAIYSLAFRVSSGMNSVASFTIVRLATVRLAGVSGSERSRYLRRLLGPVFAVGLLGAAATCLAAPLLAMVVDDGWTDIVVLVRILSFMLPFRLVHGLLGVAFLVEHADGTLFRIELARIATSLLFLSLAASAGLVTLSAMALALSIGAVVATAILLQRATPFHLVGSQRPLGRMVERISSR